MMITTSMALSQIRAAAGRVPVPTRTVAQPVAVAWSRVAELALLMLGSTLLLVSAMLPYWQIRLHAPQYPKGLLVQAYVYKLVGDVREVDGLNHYIGMLKLDTAASLERQISLLAIALIAGLTIGSFWMSGIWKALARAPIVIFPVVFVIDLFAWLYYAGHSLDPHAALSSSIKPFTPHIIGIGGIGQFSTEAEFLVGFALAVAAALVVIAVSLGWRGQSDESR